MVFLNKLKGDNFIPYANPHQFTCDCTSYAIPVSKDRPVYEPERDCMRQAEYIWHKSPKGDVYLCSGCYRELTGEYKKGRDEFLTKLLKDLNK